MKMKWSQDFILLNILFQYYEMSYGLNVEMHKQTEIVKRMSAIIGQVLPFLSQVSHLLTFIWSQGNRIHLVAGAPAAGCHGR